MNLVRLAYETAIRKTNQSQPLLFITANSHQAYDLVHQLRFFLPEDLSVLLFPDKEVLPL